MADDIVTRLQERIPYAIHPHVLAEAKLLSDAVKEIERLRKERDTWKHHANRLALWGAFSGNGLAAFHEWQQYDNTQKGQTDEQ
jgi:hypothetical protein